MKKYFAIPIIAGTMALGACKNDDIRVFDESAADRLENSKRSNFDMLCADGGLWSLEYFANTEEPGYLFVMKFTPDKAVTITSDHKWIGNTETTETSMWDVITDNGVVLTFNTYNKVFHIFSDPANIVGDGAPINGNGEDVDETGYGHEGDYEFMIMEHDADADRIRLRGKKHSLNAYLTRLDPATDVSEYLAKAKTLRSQFDAKRFPVYVMTETATGKTFDVTGLSSGILTVVPTGSTNPFAQTETKSFIVTDKGIRPYRPFDFIRSDDSHFAVEEFLWNSEKGLSAPGYAIAAPIATKTVVRKDLSFPVNMADMCEKLQNALSQANSQTQQINDANFGRSPKVTKLQMGYSTYIPTGKSEFCVQANVGKIPYALFGSIQALNAQEVSIVLDKPDEAIEVYIQKLAPKAVDLLKMFEGTFKVVNDGAMTPSVIHFVKSDDPTVTFTVNAK